MSDRVYTDAVAQGLVRFDAAGQVEPGLAQRWIVIDDGRTFIFRLRRLHWTNGQPVRAAEVAASLRQHLSARSRNPLKPFLTAVQSIRGMTPEVLEIGLSRPRPDLLKLFAQPELAITRRDRLARTGTGPFRASDADRGLLVPRPDPDRAEDGDGASDHRRVRLRGERAAAAVLRFRDSMADAVLGGGIADWPLVALAEIGRGELRVDPAAGLFGLRVERREGFLSSPAGRAAVAGAIDRTAMTSGFARDWVPTEQLLPEALDSAAAPSLSGWVALGNEDRIAAARSAVAQWSAKTGRAPVLRIAWATGPGATRLWARLAADLMRVGIRLVRTAPDAAADLRLVDAVAPYDSARWYLATACGACTGESRAALEAARLAPTLAGRAAANAAADAALAAEVGFIPIARPFRWSLVRRTLRGWQPNARAWHPLNRLGDMPN